MLWPSLQDCFEASVPEGADCISLLYHAQSFMDGSGWGSSLWEILHCSLQGNVCVFSCLEFKGWIQTQLKGQWKTWDKQLAFKREISERACIIQSVCWNFRFYLKLPSCTSAPTVQLSQVCCSQHCSSDPRSKTICCLAPSPRLVCSQGTSELSFFLRSSFYWLLATRIEWEELCFIMSLYTLPSVKPWSLSNILKKINKDPGCIWKQLHSFESNRKFIQLLLNTYPTDFYWFQLAFNSSCSQPFDIYHSPNTTNEQHLKYDPLLVFCGMKIELSASPISRKASKPAVSVWL